jgi:hypothetical protein
MSWEYKPLVIDTETGLQVASVDPPRGGWLGQDMILSPDGQQIAVAGKMNLNVYQLNGAESAWGVLVAWQFWLLVACVGVFVASLCRDARWTARRWGRSTPLSRRRAALAAVLVIAGGVALVSPLVALAMQRGYVWWGFNVLFNQLTQWWVNDGWVASVFTSYLLGGLGLIMGSRAWTLLLALALPASASVALWLAWHCGQFAEHAQCIYDRAWMLSPTWMAMAQGAWSILALGGLAILLFRRRMLSVATAPSGQHV